MIFEVILSVPLGIDMGMENIRVSIAGKMMPAESGNFEFPNTLVFSSRGRMAFKDHEFTVSRLNDVTFLELLLKLVGKPNNETIELFRTLQNQTNCIKAEAIEENGEVMFHLKNYALSPFPNEKPIGRIEGKTILRLEELIGMSFEQIQMRSQNYAQEEVRDAFLTVPPWWGPKERKIIFTAAKLGGLEPQAFVSETTAIGLSLSSSSLENPILVFSFGHSAKASILTLEPDTSMIVQNEAWLQNAAELLDACISRTFSVPLDIARRIKINLLNVGTESHQDRSMLNIKDFSSINISEYFALKCGSVVSQILEPIRKVLELPGLPPIRTIHFAGGHNSLSLISKMITLEFKSKVTFLDQTSAARGVIDSFRAQQGSPCEYLADLVSPSSAEEVFVFPRFAGSGSHNVVQKELGPDFEIVLKCVQADNQYQIGQQPFQVSFETMGIDEVISSRSGMDSSNSYIKIMFAIDWFGIPTVHRSDLFFEQQTINEYGEQVLQVII